jgi:hypothetical protein
MWLDTGATSCIPQLPTRIGRSLDGFASNTLLAIIALLVFSMVSDFMNDKTTYDILVSEVWNLKQEMKNETIQQSSNRK